MILEKMLMGYLIEKAVDFLVDDVAPEIAKATETQLDDKALAMMSEDKEAFKEIARAKLRK